MLRKTLLIQPDLAPCQLLSSLSAQQQFKLCLASKANSVVSFSFGFKQWYH